MLGLQALPSICWLPLAILWFGLSETAIVFVVLMGSLLAVAISAEDAAAGVDPILVRVLVVSARALERRRPEVIALLRAHLELTRRWRADPAAFAEVANESYGRRAGKPLREGVLADAFSRLAPTLEVLRPQLEEMARRTQALGFAPAGDVSAIVDETLLLEVTRR